MRPIVRVVDTLTGPARLQVLIFHRVLPEADRVYPGQPDARTFERILGNLKRMYRVLPLGDALDRLREGRLQHGCAALTFDDGYADNFRVALPLLKKHDVPATIYVATRYLDGGIMFNDIIWEACRSTPLESVDLDLVGLGHRQLATSAQRRQCASDVIMAIEYLGLEERDRRAHAVASLLRAVLPTDLMMTSEEVANLPGELITVGAHTHSHPILTRLPDHAAAQDIDLGRQRLQAITGQPVEHFAYPNGKPGDDYDARHVAMIKNQSFKSAVSTVSGVHVGTGDFFQIPRYTPWRVDGLRFGMMMLRNSFDRFAGTLGAGQVVGNQVIGRVP